MTLKQYLDFKNQTSTFKAEQTNIGGVITFSNSGKRGGVKSFSLGLDSFLRTLKDIQLNLHRFNAVRDYDETPWRDLGSELYSDGPSNAMSTVQTKPLFSTISKIICWANYPNLESINVDQYCPIENKYLDATIKKIEDMSNKYLIQIGNNNQQNTETKIFESTTIREFALLVFEYFYKNEWLKLLAKTNEIKSNIGSVSYTAHSFGSFYKIIGQFERSISKEELTSSNTIRYFENPIFIDNNKFYYFSTQWNGTDGVNSFGILREYFEYEFKNYKILKDGERYLLIKTQNDNIGSLVKDISISLRDSGIVLKESLVVRFTSSLLTKPFVILTGLSGSGKTKLAQAFAMWICENDAQYKIVPVGADWTNREPLLGFPNGLDAKQYVTPDSGALELIISASQEKNQDKPYFLILDEMNLSHVERYFADFLSVMESKEKVMLYSGAARTSSDGTEIPTEIAWPKNLFIVGTVNIDETTYMFSPKVLDRANVIEFRVTDAEMESYLSSAKQLNMESLKAAGAGMAADFVRIAKADTVPTTDEHEINKVLLSFFKELKKSGAEFGYRSASEILRFAGVAKTIEPAWGTDDVIDAAVMQKLLPKVHGSRNKLSKILPVLGGFCLMNPEKIKEHYLEKFDSVDFENDVNIRYKLSFEKICRMYRNAIENGYASYAEA